MSQLLNERKASAALGLSVRTLQKWRLTGRGPRFFKLGRSVRYDWADLQEFLEAARRSSTSDGGPIRTLATRLSPAAEQGSR